MSATLDSALRHAARLERLAFAHADAVVAAVKNGQSLDVHEACARQLLQLAARVAVDVKAVARQSRVDRFYISPEALRFLDEHPEVCPFVHTPGG